MKNVVLLGAAFVTLTSLPLVAEQPAASAQESTQVTAQGTQADQANKTAAGVTGQNGMVQAATSSANTASAQAGGTSADSATGTHAAEMRPVNTELQGKLDSKTAKPGDQVIVKTQQAIKTADGTELPRGTRLLGHVTSVQAHGKGSDDAAMAIQFDRAELKGGQALAIHSVIESVQPPANAGMADSMQNDEALNGPAMGAGGRMAGSGTMSGRAPSGIIGSGGAVGGGAVSGVTGLSSRTVTETGSVANAGVDSTGRAGAQAVSATSATSGDGAAGITAHATGVRGVMLATDASGQASGMLSASKQNVHLDGGTQLVLGVAAGK